MRLEKSLREIKGIHYWKNVDCPVSYGLVTDIVISQGILNSTDIDIDLW